MRNSKSIRAWMYSKNIIKFKEHMEYIKLLKNKIDKIYFLVKQNNTNIGVVDFTSITNNSAELGIYSNPKLYGKGKILMNTILNYGFNILKLKTIKANVFQNNIKAIQLYKKFNFKKIDKKDDLLYMELKYENR